MISAAHHLAWTDDEVFWQTLTGSSSSVLEGALAKCITARMARRASFIAYELGKRAA